MKSKKEGKKIRTRIVPKGERVIGLGSSRGHGVVSGFLANRNGSDIKRLWFQLPLKSLEEKSKVEEYCNKKGYPNLNTMAREELAKIVGFKA